MRVRCLPTTVIITLFLLLAGISFPKRKLYPTVITMAVNAAPVINAQSMISSDLDNLRRSIAVLRHAVGNSIAGSVLRLPSSQVSFFLNFKIRIFFSKIILIYQKK
uniref:Uncharacterized protein n=1 Tax=Onchocerca volvulus TaxID=6282 RepID=A0A8R1XVU8_ONCVO